MLLLDVIIVKKLSRVKAHMLKLPNFGIKACVKVVDEYHNEMQK